MTTLSLPLEGPTILTFLTVISLFLFIAFTTYLYFPNRVIYFSFILSKFQLYNTVFSTIVTMLYTLDPQNLLILIKLVPFYHLLPISPTLSPGDHFSTLFLWGQCFFLKGSTCKWYHAVFVFVWLISLSVIPSGLIYAAVNDKISLFLKAE